MFQRCFVDKHTSARHSFSTKFQRWNNVGSSMLNWRNSLIVVSTLLCQRWNNVDKCTSAQLSFPTKYQRWNNVDERWRSKLFQRWFNVDVFAGLKMFKIFTDCHIKTCQSFTRRAILKIPCTAFYKNLCYFCWLENETSKKNRFPVLRQK